MVGESWHTLFYVWVLFKEDPDINPHTYKHLIWRKEAKLYNGEKSFTTNGTDITGCQHAEECKEIHMYPHAQNSF